MFEGLRKSSQSFMLVVLIASLAAIFGTQWGPGSRGCNQNALRVNHVARVYGNTISEQDFQSVGRLTGLSESRNSRTLRQAIVDGLIERELLAREAERLGFSVSDDEMNREIRDGYYYISLGSREIDQLAGPFGARSVSSRQHTSYARQQASTADTPPPAFRYEDFEGWVRGYFGRTIPDYKRMMAREMLAEAMRNVVMANVRVSEDEVWRDYQRQHEQVAIRYTRFSPDFYRETVNDEDAAAVTAFAAAHQEEINRQWEQRRESLQHLPVQVRVRQIRLSFPTDVQEPTRIATQQRAEELRRRILAGEDFVRLARLYSQDETNWRDAGLTSWVAPDRVDAQRAPEQDRPRRQHRRLERELQDVSHAPEQKFVMRARVETDGHRRRADRERDEREQDRDDGRADAGKRRRRDRDEASVALESGQEPAVRKGEHETRRERSEPHLEDGRVDHRDVVGQDRLRAGNPGAHDDQRDAGDRERDAAHARRRGAGRPPGEHVEQRADERVRPDQQREVDMNDQAAPEEHRVGDQLTDARRAREHDQQREQSGRDQHADREHQPARRVASVCLGPLCVDRTFHGDSDQRT